MRRIGALLALALALARHIAAHAVVREPARIGLRLPQVGRRDPREHLAGRHAVPGLHGD